jgi:hypothetical protein
MSCECVTCCVYWMKINEIHVSFGEVLWWEFLTWRIMRRGLVMLLQYFGYAVLTSLIFKDVISSTVMWHLRFANSLSQHNWTSAIWYILCFIWNGTFLLFYDLCNSSPGMWVHKCTTCRETAVLLFPFQVNPWIIWEVQYICSIGRLPAFMGLHIYGQHIPGYVMCFCINAQEFFYVNICAVIVKMGNV